MPHKVNLESQTKDAKSVRWVCTCGASGTYTTSGRARVAGEAHLQAHRRRGQ